jgi:hypothetical protein
MKLFFHNSYSDKSRNKKQNAGTPEKVGSPVASMAVLQDDSTSVPVTGKVISGDDIESLAINTDELRKVIKKLLVMKL